MSCTRLALPVSLSTFAPRRNVLSRSERRLYSTASMCATQPLTALEVAVQALLMEVVNHLSLVRQEPIDRRLMPHGLAYHLGGRLAVDVEEGLLVDLIHFRHRGVEPDGVDDSQVVGLLL